MVAQVVRPLMQWPRWHYQCLSRATFHHLLPPPSLLSTNDSSRPLLFIPYPSSHRNVHFRSRGLRLPNAPLPSYSTESDSDSDGNSKKSRNQKKREAHRAVRWGMELANFSSPQIKRILRVASLEQEVFDALMLAKRLGRDVREGKRRQFSYIGRLLREVEPELMDGLIQATKDGDMNKFQGLAGSASWVSDDEEEEEETIHEDEEEESHDYILATRWFDGLIKKDNDITNEVYSVHNVEFDRQELRGLVRKVHNIEERWANAEENKGEVDVALMGAKRSLSRFLRGLAKQLPTE
ncbi:unnamed protein product [Ilex paraguariensis]|uniref:Uncharacterized protein n=1 Tax=Ilex paraguariensis TaxID=185542 RepID=A0ABC8UBN4_9AQUA